MSQVFIGFKANPAIAANPSATNAITKGQTALNIIPNAIVIIFIMMCLTSVILSAFTDTHPVFLVLVIISMPVEIFFSFILHDVFFQIVQTSFIGTALVQFPSIIAIMQYLPVVTLIVSVLIAVVTFIK